MQNFPGQLPHQGYPPQSPHIPYNAVPPAPPPIRSVPPPTITPGPYAPTPSIIPGPFILLILLPAIPLLLFSLGARPPDTSHLPFTTSDIFTTGAFVTVTMTIVICLGVYPEAGGAVWAWIREGANGEWDMRYWNEVKSWTGMATTNVMQQSSTYGGGSESDQVQVRSQVQWRWKYVFDERYRRWTKVKVRVPVPIEQVVRSSNSHIRPNPKGFQALSTKHLSALRRTFPDWYSEYKPKLIPSLLVISFIVFLMILLVGQILGSAYDTESSGEKRESSSSGSGGSGGEKMSSWVEREIRKRKEEKSNPEKTLKRVKEEGKKELEGCKKKGKEELKKFQKKREAEEELLKKELKKRGLPLVGLEDKKKDQDEKKPKRKKSKDDDQEDDGEGKKEENKSKSDRMKKLSLVLLGEKGSTKKNAMKEDEKAGPGWEIADNALAQNTLAQSQMNAQQMAEKLKAGG
ncbi:hypothetical protein I203_105618 [Kwoniella mangroviensis CBS 8507]|uniref:uncharacterized protein n=1 Tax=Kwoniella mangroviensis CBS 8507 TaxID=1296122 RepID=UPI00080D5BAF|nr:uncharacterized protein I203_01432 [Kwoniella mangroviensis CBS 8507]OCF69568.1 hypothetical protein I203_01432 [Kwoniella mangroviensis CBS 8507]